MAIDYNQPFLKKEQLIQLTNNLYRLTLLFPKKEPLRYKMRELADEILAKLVGVRPGSDSKMPGLDTENRSLQILEKLEVLDSFFEVAKSQDWVSVSDLLEIQKEYSKVKEEIGKFKKVEKVENTELTKVESFPLAIPVHRQEEMSKEPSQTEITQKVIPNNLEKNSRQEKILEILKEKDKAQVWEFKQIFPQVTKRTLRRDFEYLLNQGLVERIGERNATFYKLK